MAVNYFAHPCSDIEVCWIWRKNREINLQTWCLKNQLIEHSANNANIEMLVVGQPMTHTAGRMRWEYWKLQSDQETGGCFHRTLQFRCGDGTHRYAQSGETKCSKLSGECDVKQRCSLWVQYFLAPHLWDRSTRFFCATQVEPLDSWRAACYAWTWVKGT